MQASGQFHASAALSQGKETLVTIGEENGCFGRGGEEKVSLSLSEIEHRSSNPQPSQYTDYVKFTR